MVRLELCLPVKENELGHFYGRRKVRTILSHIYPTRRIRPESKGQDGYCHLVIIQLHALFQVPFGRLNVPDALIVLLADVHQIS